jgi:hypothetical protein
MNDRHVQSEESFNRILDGTLRESVRQAIGRAADLDWSFFVALYDEQGSVICFDASLPSLISEFLCGCARFAGFALPRGPVPSFEDDPEFAEIADVELRGAMERAVARAQELNISSFFDLWIASQGWTEEQFHFCCAGRLSREIFEHLYLCFHLATVASLWNGEVGQKRWWQAGPVN